MTYQGKNTSSNRNRLLTTLLADHGIATLSLEDFDVVVFIRARNETNAGVLVIVFHGLHQNFGVRG